VYVVVGQSFPGVISIFDALKGSLRLRPPIRSNTNAYPIRGAVATGIPGGCRRAFAEARQAHKVRRAVNRRKARFEWTSLRLGDLGACETYAGR
jgi:hypothetical protein